MVSNRGEDFLLEGRALESDIERKAPANTCKDLVQRGYALALELGAETDAGVEALELLDRHRGDGAMAAGGAVHGGIVNYDEGAVARKLDVEFAHVRRCVDRARKGGKRIFRAATARSAMGDVQHPTPIHSSPAPSGIAAIAR